MNATDWEKDLQTTTREEIRNKHKLRKEKEVDERIIKLLKEAVALLERKYDND